MTYMLLPVVLAKLASGTAHADPATATVRVRSCILPLPRLTAVFAPRMVQAISGRGDLANGAKVRLK